MALVRVTLEYCDPAKSAPHMRWERSALLPAAHEPPSDGSPPGSTFELLGRAFEVALREEGTSLPQSLHAFLRGALLGKEDILEAFASIPDE